MSLDMEIKACYTVWEGRLWRCPEWGDTGWKEEEAQAGGGRTGSVQQKLGPGWAPQCLSESIWMYSGLLSFLTWFIPIAAPLPSAEGLLHRAPLAACAFSSLSSTVSLCSAV